jgi:hypothetical protein
MNDTAAVVFGVVKYFSIKGGFGFIRLAEHRDVFFHVTNRMVPFPPREDFGEEGPDPVWTYVAPGTYDDAKRMPHKGAKLAFVSVIGKRGPEAIPWCFEEEWERALQGLPR